MDKNKYYAQQESFLKTVKKVTRFALAATEAFWKSMTNTYFRNFAQAAAEIVDNAIEAGAEIIAVHVLPTANGRSIEKIIFFDNGYGMPPKLIEAAITFGGTQRHNSREGTGRFGMGLPNSTFTQADKVTAISKMDGGDLHAVEVDGDLLISGAYTNPDTSSIEIPNAKKIALTKELKDIIDSYGCDFSSGTFIVLEKPKRLKIKNPGRMIDHLKQHLGVIFHKMLAIPTGTKEEAVGKLNLFVNGDRVEPCDPLFMTPGAIGFDDDSDKAQSYGQIKTKIKQDDHESTIVCDFARVSPVYWRIDKSNPKQTKGENTHSARFEVAKDYHGICIYRNDRLIDTVSSIPKYVWSNMPSRIKTKWLNNDRTLRVSISFDPALDEFFGVEVTKQQAMPSEFIWNKLHENGFFGIVGSMSADDAKARKAIETSTEVEEGEAINPAEQVLSNLAKLNESEISEDEKSFKNKEGQENLEEVAKTNVKKLNLPENKENIDAQKDVIVTHMSLPVKIDYEDSPNGPFFRFDHISQSLAVFINKDHEFYKNFYAHHETSAYARRCLDTFLGVMANRMNATKEQQTLFRRSLRIWSNDLSDALTMLFEDYSSVAEEDDSITEETKEVKTS